MHLGSLLQLGPRPGPGACHARGDDLFESTAALLEGVEAERLPAAVVARAGALVGASDAYLYLTDLQSQRLVLRAGTGIFADRIGRSCLFGHGFSGTVWRKGEPIAIDNYSTWFKKLDEIDPPPVQAILGVPIRRAGETIGVLGTALVSGTRRFTAEETTLLARFGQLVSFGLESAQLRAAAQAELRERQRAEDELLDTIARLRRSDDDLRRAHGETITDSLAPRNHAARRRAATSSA
jgi:GAF domain-containing protein